MEKRIFKSHDKLIIFFMENANIKKEDILRRFDIFLVTNLEI